MPVDRNHSRPIEQGGVIDPGFKAVGPTRVVTQPAAGVQLIPIARIKPNPGNTRTHSAKQIRQIRNSVIAFGFTNPLLVSEDGELIAGHGRYEAAKQLGLSDIPVLVVAGLSPAKRRALAIADNKIAENAGWDRERLAIEIPELAELLRTEGSTFRYSALSRSKSTACRQTLKITLPILKTRLTRVGVKLPPQSAKLAMFGYWVRIE